MNVEWARLARLSLYRAAWGGRAPRALEDAPPLTVWQWRRHVHTDPARSLLGHPALWALFAIPDDDPIWVPFGPDDIAAGAAYARGMLASAGVLPGDPVLAVAPPAPWAGNTLPYLFSSTDLLVPAQTHPAAEVFPVSVVTVGYKTDLSAFPLSRSPAVVCGSADEIDQLLRRAQLTGTTPPRFRLALLVGGESIDARGEDLAESVAQLLYLPGLFAPLGGRSGEAGVWLPAEMLTAEMVPDDEWGRGVQDLSRIPRMQALPTAIHEAGELVVTVPNTVLPLIRLRTGLRVRVEAVTPAGARISLLTRRSTRPIAERASAFTPATRR